MTQVSNGDSVRVVLAAPSLRLSTVAGLLSCAFAIAAVFVFPIVFVPTALACAIVGGVASLRRRNPGGLAASGLGVLIAIGAAVKSPAIWLAMGVAFLALHHGGKPVPAVASHDQRSYAARTPAIDPGQVAVTKALAAAHDFNGSTPALTSAVQRYAAGYQHAATRLGEIAEQIETAPPAEREQLIAAMVAAQAQLDNGHEAYLNLRDNVNRRLSVLERKRRPFTAQC